MLPDPKSPVCVVLGTATAHLVRVGAGITIRVFTHSLGWDFFFKKKKTGPVLGRNSLDAELGGYGMLLENVSQCIDKNMQ